MSSTLRQRGKLSMAVMALLAATTFASISVWAAPPDNHGNGNGHGNANNGHGAGKGNQGQGQGKNKNRDYQGKDYGAREREGVERHGNVDIRFSNDQRVVIHDYYRDQFKTGHCPPGLAKKNNGCMPPGQAKKWRIGYPLPRDVIYYDLPSVIIGRLDPPPAGYRYVRVAADILLIAIGTGMVIDAIDDLSNMY
ncbi:Nickel/cobalt transporter regulator [Methylobacillus rhizosphaerae]|uniref:Nickel/cobalt transporter regulator n=1 Tax=Methylobacillus rhizosphaerae TaxID=551994 RepID=A0A238ZM34_9PROT|nr:RcnB family protein [Methylobacillus rhizosphaerae]SNR84232.1 Nickel/cobalt transporter regulator [Methylobacillus rhizosphaerae]